MDDLPAHLYRYRDLSNGLSEFVERTICHNELYFPKPSSFNDPFDCHPVFSFESTNKELTKYYRALNKKYLPNLSRKQRIIEEKRMLKDPLRNPRNPDTAKHIQKSHTSRITEEIGILCLSSKPNDILMWSHYADSHQGICLEFDFQSVFFNVAHQVQYSPFRPILNPFKQSKDEMMEAALLTKSNQWKYESEWRIIHYQHGPGIYHFPPNALTSIIFGVQIKDTDKDKVLKWVSERKIPVKLYSTTLCEESFSLKFKEINVVQ